MSVDFRIDSMGVMLLLFVNNSKLLLSVCGVNMLVGGSMLSVLFVFM